MCNEFILIFPVEITHKLTSYEIIILLEIPNCNHEFHEHSLFTS